MRLDLYADAGTEVPLPPGPFRRSIPDCACAAPDHKAELGIEASLPVCLLRTEHMTVFSYGIGHCLVPVLAPVISPEIIRRAEHWKFREWHIPETHLRPGSPGKHAARSENPCILTVFQIQHLIIITSAEYVAEHFSGTAHQHSPGRSRDVIPRIILDDSAQSDIEIPGSEGIEIRVCSHHGVDILRGGETDLRCRAQEKTGLELPDNPRIE